MRVTKLFTKTTKSVPADETSKNAQLLIQAGYVHKEMAGVYAYLPLGKIVLENINTVIREEMDAIGGNEISMTALQRSEPWEVSGRWDDDVMDVWFRTELANGTILGLGATHEEPLTDLMRRYITSYRDLPAYPYQIQTKFRNELRSKSGLMRGREFLMKDLYSFSRDQAQHDAFYETISGAYEKVYNRLGIGDITYKTFASGGSFSKYSHEFQTLSNVGEDTIYVHREKKIAINEEVLNDEVLNDIGVKKEELVEEKAVEVGNIFTLGTRFSEPLKLEFTDESGEQNPVFMGSYGIGPSRLMGLLAEHFADEKGLVWPKAIAPFQVYLATVGEDGVVMAAADDLYHTLQDANIAVLYDDRAVRPGEKFGDADLLGIPYRVVMSNKMIEQSAYELKGRTDSEARIVSRDELLELVRN